MTPRFTVSQLEQLRRDAKKLGRKHPELSHHEVLDQVAQSKGFQNWSILARHVEDNGLVQDKPEDVRTAHVPIRLVDTPGALPLRMDVSRDELRLIVDIVDRFAKIAGDALSVDRLSLMMDLEACHCNGCPLDLEALAGSVRDFDLVHDVAGIHRHLNRETGKLEDAFLPRFAARIKRDAALSA